MNSYYTLMFLIVFCLQKEPEFADCLVCKQLLINQLPPTLILNLKRFLLGVPVRKNNLHIEFPDSLDMAPYCTEKCEVSYQIKGEGDFLYNNSDGNKFSIHQMFTENILTLLIQTA